MKSFIRIAPLVLILILFIIAYNYLFSFPKSPEYPTEESSSEENGNETEEFSEKRSGVLSSTEETGPVGTDVSETEPGETANFVIFFPFNSETDEEATESDEETTHECDFVLKEHIKDEAGVEYDIFECSCGRQMRDNITCLK